MYENLERIRPLVHKIQIWKCHSNANPDANGIQKQYVPSPSRLRNVTMVENHNPFKKLDMYQSPFKKQDMHTYGIYRWFCPVWDLSS